MISPQQVETMIQTKFPDAQVQVTGDGEHFEALIVSDEFDGKPKVQQHQMVYAAVQEAMASEAIHALSLKTYTTKNYQSTVSS